MNLSVIPFTTAVLRVALESNDGNEEKAAQGVLTVMKTTALLRERIVLELLDRQDVWKPTLTRREEHQIGTADVEADNRTFLELVEPRGSEIPTHADLVSDDAGGRFMVAFRIAVAAVAADRRKRHE